MSEVYRAMLREGWIVKVSMLSFRLSQHIYARIWWPRQNSTQYRLLTGLVNASHTQNYLCLCLDSTHREDNSRISLASLC